MKSGKFSAAQNKAENGDYVDSVGELVALCETDGFIPRFYVDQPNDKVDQTLIDMKRYTKTLITEETNLGNLIEEAIKNNQKEDEADLLLNEDGNLSDEDLIGDLEAQIKDSDYEDYNDFLEEQEINDANLLNYLTTEGRE